MLRDEDRIFTNLYGQFDSSLAGARARCDWSGTRDLILKGQIPAIRVGRQWRIKLKDLDDYIARQAHK